MIIKKACYVCGSFDHLKYTCKHKINRIVKGNNYNKEDYAYYSRTYKLSEVKHMTPRAVLIKTGLKSFNTARPVKTVRSTRPFSTDRSVSTAKSINTAHPNPIVNYEKSKTYFQKQAQTSVKRPFYKKTVLTNRHYNQKFNTVRPRAVNTAKPFVKTFKENRYNAVKPSAC
ncbi:hypothetical protein Tco_1230472 [Tanacetum coccineum]